MGKKCKAKGEFFARFQIHQVNKHFLYRKFCIFPYKTPILCKQNLRGGASKSPFKMKSMVLKFISELVSSIFYVSEQAFQRGKSMHIWVHGKGGKFFSPISIILSLKENVFAGNEVTGGRRVILTKSKLRIKIYQGRSVRFYPWE